MDTNGTPRFTDTDVGPPLLSKYTLSELCERHPTLQAPVIDGLFREGETCNVIAAPKVGKSWLVYSLALTAIMGWRWFDRFATTPGKVLLIDNELHRETLAQRIPMVADAMGIPEFEAAWMEDLEIWPLRGDLRSITELGFEFERVERGEFKLIIMDAKYRFAIDGASENDNAAEARFYNLIDRFANMTGSAFVLVHHASKGDQSGKSVTDVGAGAGAQSRAADCHLVLREHEEPNHVVLDAVTRSFKPVEPLVLRWEFPLWQHAVGMDPSNLKRSKTKQQEGQEQRDKDGTYRILAALSDGPLTESQIRKAARMGQQRCERLLGILLDDEHISETKTDRSGNECIEFAIIDTE